MAPRPWVIVSVASSIDGCIDDRSPQRLILSSPQDLSAVDALRASCDAIMVGAGTIRSDDPALQVRSTWRQWQRLASGRSPSPLKVTLTRSGDLGAARRFFGRGESLIYTQKRLHFTYPKSTMVEMKDSTMEAVMADLARRGIARLMVEGGTSIISQVVPGLTDELRIAIAPLLVGDAQAPRLLADLVLLAPQLQPPRMKLERTRRYGDTMVMHYRFGGVSARTQLA